MAATKKTYGFIGLGIMGDGMARRLVSQLDADLVVWNRDTAKATAFAASIDGDRVRVAPTPRAVVEQCTTTFAMLATPEACASVYYDGDTCALAGAAPGKSFVDCATLQPDDMRRAGERFTAAGARFLEAPVSGTKGPAAAGTLIFLCAGDRTLFDDVAPELAAMGKAAHFFGALGRGTQVKLIVNMVMGTMLASFAEGLALGDAQQLPLDEIIKVFDEGACSCPMFRVKGPTMAADGADYPPAFPLKHAQKDVRFAVCAGDDAALSLPVAAAANETFKRARALGHGDDDFCAVIEAAKKQPDAAKKSDDDK